MNPDQYSRVIGTSRRDIAEHEGKVLFIVYE